MAENTPLPVVCALIERDGRILLARRPAHKHLPLKWEFPGGKVHHGEAAEAALVREIKEELDCDITIIGALPRFAHTYDRTTIEMIPFVCHLARGSPEPRPAEHVAIAWVQPSELDTYDLAAADLPVVRSYRADAGAGPP